MVDLQSSGSCLLEKWNKMAKIQYVPGLQKSGCICPYVIMVSAIATLQRLRPAEIKAARMDALDMARALTSVQRVQSQLLTV
jgi:hypothetical protein